MFQVFYIIRTVLFFVLLLISTLPLLTACGNPANSLTEGASVNTTSVASTPRPIELQIHPTDTVSVIATPQPTATKPEPTRTIQLTSTPQAAELQIHPTDTVSVTATPQPTVTKPEPTRTILLTSTPQTAIYPTNTVSDTSALQSTTSLFQPTAITPTAIIAQPIESITNTAIPSIPATNPIERPANVNPLTGLTVSDPSVLQKRPLHIRIGNDPQARPQINLSQADIVYEELIEWWTTRFTAVFLTNTPEMVAPIRSARLINTQLTLQYDAALITSGGSDPVRWQLSQLPIVNLDEYYHSTPYFYRPNEGWQRRLAVNLVEVRRYMERKDMEDAVALRGFFFDTTPINGLSAESIYINYPLKANKVLWLFDTGLERYLRFDGGEPMIDAATNEQVSAANIIVYYAPHYRTDIVEDSTGATSVGININGIGRAQIFRDRTVVEGYWRTDGTQTPEFIDENGNLIPLKPGNVWIEVAPEEYDILIDETPSE